MELLEIRSLIIVSLLIFTFCASNALRQKRGLTLLFYSVYFLPFFPVFGALILESVVLWPTSGNYIYSVTDPIFVSYVKILTFSASGILLLELKCFLSREYVRCYQHQSILKNFQHLFNFIFFVTICSSAIYYFYYNHLMTYILIILLLSLILTSNNKKISTFFVWMAVANFSHLQILNGDREFVPLVIFILFNPFYKNQERNFLKLVVLIVLVLLALFVTINRNGNDLSFFNLLVHLQYNSWTASLLPLLDYLTATDDQQLLYGVTVIDAIISSFLKFVFVLVGEPTPYQLDNPAYWFYTKGLGGAHLSMILLANFGVYGVVISIMAIAWILNYCQYRANRSFYFMIVTTLLYIYVFYICWYSIVPFFNAFLHGIFLYVIFLILKFMLYTRKVDQK